MTGSIPPPNPLAYEGQVVVPYIIRNFPPQTTFNTFPVPTIWIDPQHEKGYIQVAKPLGVADWVLFAGGTGGILEIDTPDGTHVTPVAGVVNFLNGTSMNITGAGNNITFNSTIEIDTPDATHVHPVNGVFNFLNGTGVNITGSGNNITFGLSGAVAELFTADSGTATPSSGNLIITGSSTGLTTTGSGHTIGLTGTLAIAHGGTNATSMSTSDGIVKYDGTSLVTSSTAKIDSSNKQTNTSQPCFQVYLTNNVSNVTGDNTIYNLQFDTIAFDQSSNITLNSGSKTIFTAPVTGKYMFNGCINFIWTVAPTFYASIIYEMVSTGGTYRLTELAFPDFNNVGSGFYGNPFSLILSMTAGDTAYLTAAINNASGKNAVFRGSVAPFENYWCGYLLC